MLCNVYPKFNRNAMILNVLIRILWQNCYDNKCVCTSSVSYFLWEL